MTSNVSHPDPEREKQVLIDTRTSTRIKRFITRLLRISRIVLRAQPINYIYIYTMYILDSLPQLNYHVPPSPLLLFASATQRHAGQ